jgi:hypothetical protein
MNIVEGAYAASSLAGDSYYHQHLGLHADRPDPRRVPVVRTADHQPGTVYTAYDQHAAAPVTQFQIADARMNLDQTEFTPSGW